MSVSDISVKQFERVGDPHLFARFIYAINHCIHTQRKVIGGRDLHIGAGRGFRCKMRCGFQVIAETGFGFHAIGAEDMLAVGHQGFLLQSEIGVATRLVKGHGNSSPKSGEVRRRAGSDCVRRQILRL